MSLSTHLGVVDGVPHLDSGAQVRLGKTISRRGLFGRFARLYSGKIQRSGPLRRLYNCRKMQGSPVSRSDLLDGNTHNVVARADADEFKAEHMIPPFSWDQVLPAPILRDRFTSLGLNNIQDLGALVVFSLEEPLTGVLGLQANRLFLDFKDWLERNLILRPFSTQIAMSSSRFDDSSVYECSLEDDDGRLSWRVTMSAQELEDVWPAT